MNWTEFTVIALIVSNGMVLPAQTQTAEGTPKAPFVMKTPESGTWMIAINAPRSPAPTSEAVPSSGEKVKIAFPVSVSVAKTGEIVSEVWTYSDGSSTQRWAFKGAQVEELKGATELFRRIPDARSFELFNYREKDFPHYWWVNTGNFKGVEVISGRPCNVFHDTVMVGGHSEAVAENLVTATPVSPEEVKAAALFLAPQPRDVTAYIDAETLQPLLIKIDAETRAYKYGAAPATPLVLPPRFQAELDSWLALVQAVNRPHKAP